MKTRVILTVLCLCLGFSAMAQRHGNRGNRGNRGAQSAQQAQMTPQSLDMVVDTAIINSMELEEEVVAQVLQLQAKKAEELKAKIIEMASQFQGLQMGQQMTPEAAAEMKEKADAMREQIEEFKFEYRMQLRKILGVENYINYLEKQVDKRPQMPAGFGQGQQRRGNWGGGQMPQGNWGGQAGGGFGGGGWNDNAEGFGGGFGGGFGE